MKDRKLAERMAAEQTAAHVALIGRLGAGWAGTLADVAQLVISSLCAGGKVLLAGNGGSAADAQHVAAELVGRFRRERKAFPAIALTTDSSILTAVGNDYAFDNIFARQVEALARPGDVLWLFSTSGNSANVLRAAEAGRKRGATIVAFTGGDGGRLAGLAEAALVVPDAATALIQEGHALAYHIVCDLVEMTLGPEPEISG